MGPTTTAKRAAARALGYLAVGMALLVLAARARGDLSYVQQQRSVSASALGTSQTFSAPDFAPFDRTASAASSAGQGSTGLAEQHSTLDPSRLTMSGSTQAHGSSGSASSTLTAQFDVAELTPYTLTGQGGGNSGVPDLHSSILLASDAVTVASWDSATGPAEGVNSSGTLAPGHYTLDARFSAANAPGFTAVNSYFVTLQVPEAAIAPALALGFSMLIARRRRPASASLSHLSSTRSLSEDSLEF